MQRGIYHPHGATLFNLMAIAPNWESFSLNTLCNNLTFHENFYVELNYLVSYLSAKSPRLSKKSFMYSLLVVNVQCSFVGFLFFFVMLNVIQYVSSTVILLQKEKCHFLWDILYVLYRSLKKNDQKNTEKLHVKKID